MECLLQFLDEVDDIVGCVALKWDIIRTTLLNLLFMVLVVEAVAFDDPTWLFSVIAVYSLLIPTSLIVRAVWSLPGKTGKLAASS